MVAARRATWSLGCRRLTSVDARLLPDRLHILQENDAFVVLEHLSPLVSSLDQNVLRERILITNFQELSGAQRQHHERFFVVWIVEIRVLARLIEQDADVTEVAALLKHSILIHAFAIHDVRSALQDEVHALWLFAGVLDYGRLLILQPVAVVFLLLDLLAEVVELGAVEYGALELEAASLENAVEGLVEILEDRIEDVLLESRL